MSVLSKPIEGLVEYLVQGYEDDMSKVRVLYRWLTNQPIHRMQSLEHEPKDSQSALYYLWLLRTKKQRYSKVFSTLCRSVLAKFTILDLFIRSCARLFFHSFVHSFVHSLQRPRSSVGSEEKL